MTMRLRHLLAVLSLLAACGGTHKDEVLGANGGGAGPGCPDALDVRVASIGTVTEQRVWLMHEAIVPEEKDDLFTADERGDIGQKLIPSDAAIAHGADHSSEPVWLFVGDDKEPCKAQPTLYLAQHGGDGAFYTSVVRVLEGCVPPEASGAPSVVYAFQAKDVGSCRFREPRVLSERHEGNGATSLPSELGSLVPDKACDLPDCDARWRVRVNDFEGKPGLYEVLVSWVYPVEGDNECDWKVEDFAGHFVSDPDTGKLARFEAEGSQDGVLYDRSGPRAVITRVPGTYVVTRVGAAPALVATHQWYLPHEEDFGGLGSLGPYCGP
jgi:hypothetical protein